MSLDQLLRLSQTLQLNPALLQSMSILQMNTLELSDYLNDLALENPTLEYADDGPSWAEFAHQVPWLADAPAGGAPSSEGGIPESVAAPEETTLPLLLDTQLEARDLDPPLLALCRYLADSLDDHGRLEEEDLEALTKAGVPAPLLEQAVATLQSLDPPGIAARSPSECLLLQLRRLPGDHSLAQAICRDHLAALAKGDTKGIAAALGVSEAQVRDAAQTIRTLDPDPVGDLTPPAPVQYVRPDVWVAQVEGKLQVFVNQWDLPQFQVSRDYQALSRTQTDQETADYLRRKIHEAQWVLRCVQRRQETLRNCVTALVEAQEEYFLEKASAPGPLLRRELAETLGVSPSTVTRTLGHKHLQCRQGLFPLSYFFARNTGSTQTPQSEQGIKNRICQAVKAENPRHPLSDQALRELLAEEGLLVARRTVTKYRAALGIPASPQRRRK
jgi:RNA polymerase sigma-54 factor